MILQRVILKKSSFDSECNSWIKSLWTFQILIFHIHSGKPKHFSCNAKQVFYRLWRWRYCEIFWVLVEIVLGFCTDFIFGKTKSLPLTHHTLLREVIYLFCILKLISNAWVFPWIKKKLKSHQFSNFNEGVMLSSII